MTFQKKYHSKEELHEADKARKRRWWHANKHRVQARALQLRKEKRSRLNKKKQAERRALLTPERIAVLRKILS